RVAPVSRKVSRVPIEDTVTQGFACLPADPRRPVNGDSDLGACPLQGGPERFRVDVRICNKLTPSRLGKVLEIAFLRSVFWWCRRRGDERELMTIVEAPPCNVDQPVSASKDRHAHCSRLSWRHKPADQGALRTQILCPLEKPN